MFDFDTKHIIDPNDPEKRLLSLSEAIEIGLILPRTFELSLSTRLGLSINTQSRINPQKLNLYDAFFNTKHLNLSLLLYKPEIENVYIRLMSSSAPINVRSKQDLIAHQNKLAVLLSKREKIGLIEAINLNVVDLATSTYTTLLTKSEHTYNEEILANFTFSLPEAVFKYKLVDAELIDLLQSPIGIKRNKRDITLLDCLRDSTLLLDKYMFKNPFSNEYMQLESHSCKAMLSEETVRKIKRLVTRINVKSYIISLNPNAASSQTPVNHVSQQQKEAKSAQLINVKTPTVVYNKIVPQQQQQQQQQRVLVTRTPKPQENAQPELKSYFFGQEDLDVDEIAPPQQQKQSQKSSWLKPSRTLPEISNLIKEQNSHPQQVLHWLRCSNFQCIILCGKNQKPNDN